MKVISRPDKVTAQEAAAFIIDTISKTPWESDVKHGNSSIEESELEPEVSRELTVQVAKKLGVDLEFYDFIEYLKIPNKVWAAIHGLDEWEDEVSGACKGLIHARKIKHFIVASHCAKAIGALISEQLLKGNYNAPSIVSKGLKNLEKGKSFRPQAGRQPSIAEAIRVVITFYYLKSIGIDKPTQAKVRNELVKHKIGSGTMAKIFSKIGLKTLAGDGRKVKKNRPSKRKTSNQKLIRKHSIGL